MILLAASTLVLLIFARTLLVTKSRRSPLPPGPKGLPLIGNIHQLSRDAWNKFTEWKRTHGPVVHIKLFGQDVIVLNTLKAATDLLDKRAAIYSSRPQFYIVGQMLTEGYFFVFQSYGELWRRMRRAAHESLRNGAVQQFGAIETAETALLLKDLLAAPQRWEQHMERMAASTLLAACYGTDPALSADDPAMKLLHTFTRQIVQSGYVDGNLVEYLPFLRHIPTSLAPWKKAALEWAPKFTRLFGDLYSHSRDRVINGGRSDSISAMMVENQDKYNLTDKETAWLVATIAAAYDTLAGVMSWWALAMVLYPDVQKKAQAEIDSVVGRTRLPSLEDLDKLVYVKAMLKEALRWHPVGPLGMQHRSTEDDVYEGYFIPKGTICIANVWAINRDPTLWGLDADEFRPERYLEPTEALAAAMADTKDEGHVSFGFGRRICVGRHLARDSLLLNMASILWMFNIKAPLDASGKEIYCVEDSVDHGLVVRPQEYQHRFEPRFPDAQAIFESHKESLDM
ncbi:cytochrome P450 [Trametes coccinea BRFM310]|uniref:Cytochrome P450 n=1 Tax=Trametes coccinea (strain BRFM310) TaxID=1353009 RepID=A0A1Y2ILQ0_TRAC3|nr:cytochrome P450 [Trametes coccinea BRFM310]